MAMKLGKLPLILFLSCVFLAWVSLCVGYERERTGRELDACLSECSQESDMHRYLACRSSCELKQRGRDPEERRREEGQSRRESEERQREEDERLRHEEKGSQQREREEREREDERRRREEQEGGRGRDEGRSNDQQRENPYHFQSHRFQTRFRSQNGQCKVLPKFNRASNLLRGLKNFRFGVYDARPHTVSIPHHTDAGFIIIVAKGNATVTFANKNNRESYNLDQGDVLRVAAGSTTYFANRNDNENLRIIELVNPVNNPGEFENFFGGGRGNNPQSYLSVFSRDVLQASFNRPLEEIERTFGGQQRREQAGREQQQERGQEESGIIVRAPEEVIRSLSRRAQSTKGGKATKSGPFNLWQTKAEFSNQFGRFFEANPDEFQQFQDWDVSVNAAEIQQGVVMLPHFNSRTTVLAYVAEGTGRFEIACPHVARQRGQPQPERGTGRRSRREEEEEEGEQQEWVSGEIDNVKSDVSPGDLVVIPAGHPFAVKASQNQNLRLIGFGINAHKNQRNFVAGSKDNVLNQFEKEELDILYNGRGEEVQRLFKGHRESYFARADQARQEQEEKERQGPLSSILAGFF